MKKNYSDPYLVENIKDIYPQTDNLDLVQTSQKNVVEW